MELDPQKIADKIEQKYGARGKETCACSCLGCGCLAPFVLYVIFITIQAFVVR